MNQPGTDSFSLQQEQEHDHVSAVDLWLGADAAQRQALAAWLLWSRWYRLPLASFRNDIQFDTAKTSYVLAKILYPFLFEQSVDIFNDISKVFAYFYQEIAENIFV
jgi:hypothetical protein